MGVFRAQVSFEDIVGSEGRGLEGAPEMMVEDEDGAREIPAVLPEMMDVSVTRARNTEGMGETLGGMLFSSCSPAEDYDERDDSDVGLVRVQGMMDVSLDEDEGTADAENALGLDAAVRHLQDIAARLSAGEFDISRSSPTTIAISNARGQAEPNLRYVVYIPFLHLLGMDDLLEAAAGAFVHELGSRFTSDKTYHLEFVKSPSTAVWSILETQRRRNDPENYIGGLTTFPKAHNDTSKVEKGGTTRAYPIARSERAEDNDPTTARFEACRTFVVILDRPGFGTVGGGVRFLLADGGKWRDLVEEGDTESLDGTEEVKGMEMNMDMVDYVEMQTWRCAGMDEVARRLQMVWGGVLWEQGVKWKGHNVEE